MHRGTLVVNQKLPFECGTCEQKTLLSFACYLSFMLDLFGITSVGTKIKETKGAVTLRYFS